jgi:hypothetical protein
VWHGGGQEGPVEEVPAVATIKLRCEVCAGVRVFERPPCGDEHGADCPEWACTRCGSAALVAPIVMLVDRRAPVLLRRRTNARRAA